MQADENQIITKRFFEALYALKSRGDIRGKQTFTARWLLTGQGDMFVKSKILK